MGKGPEHFLEVTQMTKKHVKRHLTAPVIREGPATAALTHFAATTTVSRKTEVLVQMWANWKVGMQPAGRLTVPFGKPSGVPP